MEFFGWVLTFIVGIFIGVNCSWTKISPEEWNKAEELCSTNQGIDKFITKTIDPNSVVCKNTARFTLKDEKK